VLVLVQELEQQRVLVLVLVQELPRVPGRGRARLPLDAQRVQVRELEPLQRAQEPVLVPLTGLLPGQV
jgi:hypothetical protein